MLLNPLQPVSLHRRWMPTTSFRAVGEEAASELRLAAQPGGGGLGAPDGRRKESESTFQIDSR